MNNLLSQISAQNGGAISPSTLSNGVLGLINNPNASMPSISKNLQELARLTQDNKLSAILNMALNNGGIKANANDICMALSQLNPELLNELVTANLPQKNSAIFADGGNVTERAKLVIVGIQNIGEENFVKLHAQNRYEVVVKALTLFDGHAVKAAKHLNLPFRKVSRFLVNQRKDPQMTKIVKLWHKIVYSAFKKNNFNRGKTADALEVTHSYIERLIYDAKNNPDSLFHNLRTSRPTKEDYLKALAENRGVRSDAAEALNINKTSLSRKIGKTPALSKPYQNLKGTAHNENFSNYAIAEAWRATKGNLADMAVLLDIKIKAMRSRLKRGAERNCPYTTPLTIEIAERKKQKTTIPFILDKLNVSEYHYSQFELRDDFKISDGRLAIMLTITKNLYETLCEINLPIAEIFKQIRSADENSPLYKLIYLTLSSLDKKQMTIEDTEHLLAYTYQESGYDIEAIHKSTGITVKQIEYYFNYPKTKILAQVSPKAIFSSSIKSIDILESLIKHHGNRELVTAELGITDIYLDNLLYEKTESHTYSDLKYFSTGYWKNISYDFDKPRKFFTHSDSHLANGLKKYGPVERTAIILKLSINEIEMQIRSASSESPLSSYTYHARREGYKFSDYTIAVKLVKFMDIKKAADDLGISIQEINQQNLSAESDSQIRTALLRIKKYKPNLNRKKTNKPPAKRPETPEEISRVDNALKASKGHRKVVAEKLGIAMKTLDVWIFNIPELKENWYRADDQINHAMQESNGNFISAAKKLKTSVRKLFVWIDSAKEDSILKQWQITDKKIYKALFETGGKLEEACVILGLTRDSLKGRIDRFKKNPNSHLYKLNLAFFRNLKLAQTLADTEGNVEEAARRMKINATNARKLIRNADVLNPLCPFKGIKYSSRLKYSEGQIYEAWLSVDKRLHDVAVLFKINYTDLLKRINKADEDSFLYDIKQELASTKTAKIPSVLAWLEKEDLESIKPEDFKIREGFKISDARLFIKLSTSNNLYELLRNLKVSVKEFTKQIMSSDEDSFLREFETLVNPKKQSQKTKDQLLAHSMEHYHFNMEAVSRDTGLSPTQIINRTILSKEKSPLYQLRRSFGRKHLIYNSELSEHPELWSN